MALATPLRSARRRQLGEQFRERMQHGPRNRVASVEGNELDGVVVRRQQIMQRFGSRKGENRILPPVAYQNLEPLLASGERLRINAGVDAVTLRTVLSTLRA